MKEIKEQNQKQQYGLEKMDWLLNNPNAVEVFNTLPTNPTERKAFLDGYRLAKKHGATRQDIF